MLLIFHRFASCYVVDQLVSIISRFAFTINLAQCLFTLYTFFVTDGKRAPTIIGRGSFPRSRTGCDIFNCVAAQAVYSVGLLLFVTLTFQSYAVIQTATRPAVKSAIPAEFSILCSRRCGPCWLDSVSFNLMQPCRLRCLGFNFAITSAISILCSHADYFGNRDKPFFVIDGF